MERIYKLHFLEVGVNRSLIINKIVYQSGFKKNSLSEDVSALKIMIMESNLYNVDQMKVIFNFLNGLLLKV